MRSLRAQRAKRLPRLSAWVPSGTCIAIWGRCVLLLPTMPLIRAARVVKCRATVPVGWPGYPCVRAARMARYLRRLSLIADSFWIDGSFQREYTMRQPLNPLFQDGLAKCPVENLANTTAGAPPCTEHDVHPKIAWW